MQCLIFEASSFVHGNVPKQLFVKDAKTILSLKSLQGENAIAALKVIGINGDGN